MAIANFDLIDQFARERFERAKVAAEDIKFALNEKKSHFSREAGSLEARASGIANEPHYARLETEFGLAAWAVILSVDLRQSSQRAVEIGALDTYLTMHTYLPTMAKLVTDAGGLIVGLRGDGLFASFGLSPKTGASDDFKPHVASAAAKDSTSCGKAMLEATEEILNPILKENNIRDDLMIGVGISSGEIVVTRIGLSDANELTTYGAPVNQACKMCSKTTGILLHPNVEKLFPTSQGGKVRFHQSSDGFSPIYPPGTYMLERTQRHMSRTWPR